MSTNTIIGTITILKGSKNLGLAIREKLYVFAIEPMGADYSHNCRVEVSGHKGKHRSFYVRHVNRLGDVEFNLHNGTGVNPARGSYKASPVSQ